MRYGILREFLGHNFVSNLRTLKPKKSKNLKKFLKNLGFFQPWFHGNVSYKFIFTYLSTSLSHDAHCLFVEGRRKLVPRCTTFTCPWRRWRGRWRRSLTCTAVRSTLSSALSRRPYSGVCHCFIFLYLNCAVSVTVVSAVDLENRWTVVYYLLLNSQVEYMIKTCICLDYGDIFLRFF